MSAGILIAAAVSALLPPVAIALWFRSLKKKRLIENVPTSKVEGVFIGLTEVKGDSECDSPLTSYLAGVTCVHYNFSVQEHWRRTVSYTDSDGKRRTKTESGWKTVRSDDVRCPFFVRDETGAIRIDPHKAQMQGDSVFSQTVTRGHRLYYQKGPRYSVANSTGRRRFTETAVQVDKRLYVMGTAKLREDIVEPEIRHDPDAAMFLISTRGEEQIVRGYNTGAVLWAIGGAIASVAAPIVLTAVMNEIEIGAALARSWPISILTAAAYGLVGTFLYLLLVYNGLVDVRNRLKNAWSLIDVQLKRRHDLIPNLVEVVKGYALHEKELQEELARLRTESFAGRDAPGIPDVLVAAMVAGVCDEQTRRLKELFTTVERYPDIKANQGFLKLNEELSRTERKISLARSFFNESVTAFNDRIQTLPDAVIASPMGFKEAAWFKIEPFEAKPVLVKFEETQTRRAERPKDFEDEEVPEGATAVTDADIDEAERGGWGDADPDADTDEVQRGGWGDAED